MLDFLVLALATWRITSIVQAEEIAKPFRRLFGVTFNQMLQVEQYPDTFLGHLIKCFWCVSVWAGFVCASCYFIEPRVLYPFAASALAIIMDKVL